MGNGIKRRDFFKLGITGLAGLTACAKNDGRKILSPVNVPEDFVPGVPIWYASTCTECPAGCGIHVKTIGARATKIEGNPVHPVNRGGLCPMGQASIQGLYNPDRFQNPAIKKGREFAKISWDEGVKILAEKLKSSGGKSAFITGGAAGSFRKLIKDFMKKFGSEKVAFYEPVDYSFLREANEKIFGLYAVPEYKINKAKFILSIGADFLETYLNPVKFTKEFSGERNDECQPFFVYAGPRRSITGANADEWIPVAQEDELHLVLGILNEIVNKNLYKKEYASLIPTLKKQVTEYSPEKVSRIIGISEEKIIIIARGLCSNPSIIIGPGNGINKSDKGTTATVINLINALCGNIGKTVIFYEDEGKNNYSIQNLARDIANKKIDVLMMKDANIAFYSSEWDSILNNVPYIVNFSYFPDETTEYAHLLLPDHHFLEKWDDVSITKTHSLQQPVMNPLFNTMHTGDVLIQTADSAGYAFKFNNYREFLKTELKSIKDKANIKGEFEIFLENSFKKGFVDLEKKSQSPSVKLISLNIKSQEKKENDIGLLIYPSPLIYDGRGANKPWLLETPDPVTKIVWGNWAEIHPETASRLGITDGDSIIIEKGNQSIEIPAFVTEGIHKKTIAIPMGYGRTNYGRFANDTGENIKTILNSESSPLTFKRGNKKKPICLQGSFNQFGRGIIKFKFEGAEEHEEHENIRSMYPAHEHKTYRWGMVIDLNKCTGCGACVVACYAENNIAVVGKKHAAEGREMSWIRIESYIEGKNFLSIPMLCQQCDNGPCEPVCPVYATYHNPEGLNVQVYNRCVGTRYCSHNCPYKVRRFNFFDYKVPEPLNLQYNQDVTVREKGIMEKCTFCIQRIRDAKDTAKDENRRVRDGEIKPACAQSCPADAIVFGDMNNPGSLVHKLSKSSRGYRVFEHLNTKSAITYLKRIIRKNV